MNAQTPAEGISKLFEADDMVAFRVNCECQNVDDAIDVLIEYDEEISNVMITFDTVQSTPYWKELATWQTHKIDNWFLYLVFNSLKSLINGLAHRAHITYDVWVHGYVKSHSTTLLSKQAALNLANVLIDYVEKMESNSQEKRSKRS